MEAISNSMLTLGTGKIGRPRSKETKARKGSIDEVNAKFQAAKAKREEIRMLPDPAIVEPHKRIAQEVMQAAIVKRNAPVKEVLRPKGAPVAFQLLESGILEVHIPARMHTQAYHDHIGSMIFPDRYTEEVTETRTWDKDNLVWVTETKKHMRMI